jgi:hypothetical protein
MIRLSPNCLRLRLHTALCSQNRDTSVKDTQGTFNFYREVNVTRGVNDVDAASVPVAGSSCGCDRDTSLLFLFHVVHGSSTVVSLTQFVVYTCVKQNTLRGSGLTGINVSHDTNISSIFQ